MATTDTVLRLFPGPPRELALTGLYLDHGIRELSHADRWPYIYTNFIASLDGRISETDPATGLHNVPRAIANPHDWGLYLELVAQADVLLTTARHLRAVAAGRHQQELHVDAYPALAAWRRAHHLAPQPAVAAVSEGLDIPAAALRDHYAGPLVALAGSQAPPPRAAALRAAGIEVATLPGDALLDGRAVAEALAARGYRYVCSIAGPRVNHALLAAQVVARFYFTLAPVAIGGREFETLAVGDALDPPARFALQTLYLDRAAPAGAGQLFASYDAVH